MNDQVQIIQPSTPMEVMTLFDADAKKLDSFIDYVASTIESGMDDPLKVLAMSKKMEYVTKRINDRIKDAAKREAEKNGDKPFNAFGCEIKQEATSTRYDYSNDSKWVELDTATRAREEFLKGLKSPLTIVDEETGEIITVRPPVKNQTFGLKITVK